MSVTVILEAAIKPGKKDALVALLDSLLPETRAYQGLTHITIHTDAKGENILFYEEWESAANYEDYLQWRTETGVMDKLGAHFSAPPAIRYFNPENI
ncbi:MAG TPA: hypothetical protein DD979_05750 [Gammaproteobacteria bacterium]|jgi:quinol monooxygenase YgiN|nr:hypothetical protein [Gammaproteobacteria bacterium]